MTRCQSSSPSLFWLYLCFDLVTTHCQICSLFISITTHTLHWLLKRCVSWRTAGVVPLVCRLGLDFNLFVGVVHQVTGLFMFDPVAHLTFPTNTHIQCIIATINKYNVLVSINTYNVLVTINTYKENPIFHLWNTCTICIHYTTRIDSTDLRQYHSFWQY
jgi:hypothetical protein